MLLEFYLFVTFKFWRELGLTKFPCSSVAPSPTTDSPRTPTSSPSPPRGAQPPLKKKKRKPKGKKARKLAEKKKRKAALEKLRHDLFPKSILAQKAPRLDSVFLFWKLGNTRLRKLSPSTLLQVFEKEIHRFKKLTSGQCKKIADSLRETLITTALDRDELASRSVEENPRALRDLWVNEVKREMSKISSRLDSVPSGSLVESFLANLPRGENKPAPSHPRGVARDLPEDADDDSDGFESDSLLTSSSDDDDGSRPVHPPTFLFLPLSSSLSPALLSPRLSHRDGSAPRDRKRKRAPEYVPLSIDRETESHLRRIKKMKSVTDLDARTVDWISDLFCNNSSHIRQIVEGKHRDIAWSRGELKFACAQLLALFDKAKLREESGDQLSREAKKNLMKSESHMFAEVRLSLHVLRLGRAGANRFRQNLEDEKARKSFEDASGSSRAYKLFAKELEESRKRSSNYAAARYRNRVVDLSAGQPRKRQATARRQQAPQRRPAQRYRPLNFRPQRNSQPQRRAPAPQRRKCGHSVAWANTASLAIAHSNTNVPRR